MLVRGRFLVRLGFGLLLLLPSAAAILAEPLPWSFLHIRGKRLHRLRDRLAPAGREVLLEQGRRAPVWISFLAAARARQSFGTLALRDECRDVQSRLPSRRTLHREWPRVGPGQYEDRSGQLPHEAEWRVLRGR